ncbi:hypothetical protein N7478_002289 [Penicillium angulare]|uniref:uncharacterized protein n=1 Tax=Penicillium angulare TaxID=116970 RepID=UPI00253F6E57|nr:uncharacterized protein N7478_002289 [Penicillium angulare]KAJ5286603.1 hypothetical protein N7478_002289 [Penicillium angulare]
MEVFEVFIRDMSGPVVGVSDSEDHDENHKTIATGDAAQPDATNYGDPQNTNPSFSYTNTESLVSSTTSSTDSGITPAVIPSSITADAASASSASSSTSDIPTITASATNGTSINSSGSSSSSGGGTSTKTKLAIAIPVAVVGAIIIMAIVFFFLRRRRRRRQAPMTPTYEVAKNQDTLLSTSQLMAATLAKQQKPEQASGSMPRFPMLDVPDSRDGDISPGSSGQMSQNESSHGEMGFGMAVAKDQRPDATEQELRHISRSASPANAVGTQIHLPLGGDENEHTRIRDDDDVSVVSDYHGQRGQHEHDYDDLSSVSSFEGDTPRADDHQHPFR